MKTRSVMLILFVFIFTTTLLFAQNPTEKGRVLLDVDFGLNFGNLEIDDDFDTDVEQSVLETDIGVGYIVIDDLEVGLTISVNNESMDIKNDFYHSETTGNTTTFVVHSRYFFMKEQALRPFVLGSGGFGTSKTTASGSEDTKSNISVFGGGVGVAYFINSHIGLELNGMYSFQNIADNDSNDTSNDISGSGFHLSLGTIVSF